MPTNTERRALDAQKEPKLHQRLGRMADAMVLAKAGPQARFFTRTCVDEVVLLLREAEKAIIEGSADLLAIRRDAPLRTVAARCPSALDPATGSDDHVGSVWPVDETDR